MAASRTSRRIAIGVAVAAVLALGVVQVRRWMFPYAYHGTTLQAEEPAASLSELRYTDGTSVDLTAFGGELTLLFFGYTHCPDVCPTTLSTLAKAVRLLGDRGDRVNVIMVTVDPDRDDAATLERYVTSFDSGFRAVHGSVEDLERVASAYGVFFARGEDVPGGGYAMDHTATIMGIDRSGLLRLVWPGAIAAPDLAADLGELLS